MSWWKYAAVGGVCYATGIVTAPVLAAVGAGVFIQKKIGGKKVEVVHVPYPEKEEKSEEISTTTSSEDET